MWTQETIPTLIPSSLDEDSMDKHMRSLNVQKLRVKVPVPGAPPSPEASTSKQASPPSPPSPQPGCSKDADTNTLEAASASILELSGASSVPSTSTQRDTLVPTGSESTEFDPFEGIPSSASAGFKASNLLVIVFFVEKPYNVLI